MDDRLDPRFAAAVRGALLEEVREGPDASPAPRRPRWQPVLAIGLAAAAVAGIVAGGVVLSRDRSAPPAAPPFGGDCAAVLTSAAASDLVGAQVSLLTSASLIESDGVLPVRVAGGLDCTWRVTGAPVDDVAGVMVTVLPAGDRPTDDGRTGCYDENGGSRPQWTCSYSTAVGGRWYSGYVTGPVHATEATVQALLPKLRERLAALPAETGAVVLDTDGWWRRTGCGRFQEPLRTALDRPSLRSEQGNGSQVTAGVQAAKNRFTAANCIVDDETDEDHPFAFEVHAFRGGAAAAADTLADAERLPDVGAAHVYRVVGTSDGVRLGVLLVVDGPNLLELSVSSGIEDPRALRVAVTPMLAVLDVR